MRTGWDQYFMNMAEIAKTRSTCIRRQIGAIIVRDRYILSSGYNGAPSKCAHCTDTICLRDELGVPSGERHELCRAIHAEQNAILQCAAHGVSTKNSTLYVTTQPCSICAKMTINAGITKVVYKDGYPDYFTVDILREAGVELIKYED